MPDDWLNVALRFALYLDLMILFGIALFGIYALLPDERSSGIARQYAVVMAATVVFGVILSLCSMVVMTKAMTGASDYSELTSHIFGMVLTSTAVGRAWIARIAALAVCTAAIIALRRRPDARFATVAGAASVALVTAAWAGHGAMDDGLRGYVHLALDALHLIAAGAWVGALAAFVLMSAKRHESAARKVETLNRTAKGFAHIGTLIVLTLLITGAVNYLLIVGPTVQGLLTTRYGELLVAKLTVFVLMLGLAAVNRFLLSPRLHSAVRAGNHAKALGMLRSSLATEASLAIIILALVAWLGVLSPIPT